jgi:hypothetical protein
MSDLPAYVSENARELARMRAIVEGLDEGTASRAVNPEWTVAGILGHIAFWDGRMLALGAKFDRGEPFTGSDEEPDDVTWINDAARPLIQAVPPLELARLALSISEETDARAATWPVDAQWPADPASPLYGVRAEHRREHLDEIEAALGE